MGPVRSGTLALVDSRAPAAADTDHPNATNPTAPLRVGDGQRRSRDAWVSVSNAAADAGVSVTITIFGSLSGAAASWRVVGQLNSGAPIVPGTSTAITQANRIAYAEAVPGLLGWPYLWPIVTGTVAQALTIAVYGEEA